ncbi:MULTISPECIES: efflux RND transporter permease subunit [Acidiphilium]|uniref:efflux RND transporter permease subunit n=1 Tax=Acidiphilium TaxID=522 RepID=UPI0002144548|nr:MULTISPECIES: efflux RND transporter permease subunit [Acidiphilium]EGO95607.1 Acriflavin resistance protein [Acidiphilium sp. PM]MBU6356349.1 efflux RND transporter permease subunit [Rhodospirillales bacterium]UNC14804.1 MMPL family transporter [Acidiphilium multivorum]
MKNLTTLFIRRPVLSIVVSAAILVLGLRALAGLPVLEYPKTENATITITTTYPGADPNTIAGFVTTPIEHAIAQVNGIDYMTSQSQTSTSTIKVFLILNYNPDKALTEIQAQIQSVLNQLPSGTQQPQLKLQVGQQLDAMYIGFKSNVLSPNQITDYLTRVVQPQLQSVPGVQTAEILGAQNFAMRIWLEPAKLAAYGLTATNVYDALAGNDFISALGNTKGTMTQDTLTASTSLHSAAAFRRLIVKQSGGAIVRLGDVARVKLGSDSYDAEVAFDGKPGVYIGIQVAPAANLLSVISGVEKRFPEIQKQLPAGLDGAIVYNSAAFVNASIHEVVAALIEALLIVVLVVFAFLGTPRSVFIPVIAIPLSLIGTFAAMLMLGFSINLLTLLALVLAIGLVVDDAIIVVENVNRHLDNGETKLHAAINAAAELANPIIAMTVVLAAVYVPIGFQSGLTGALFTEFAFTLVSAVTVSAIIALTLSPMLSSRLLHHIPRDGTDWEARLVHFIDKLFNTVHRRYMRMLRSSLRTLPVTLVFGAIVLGSIYFLAAGAKSELAPQEDQGVVILSSTSAPNATLQQKLLWDRELNRLMMSHKSVGHTFQFETPTFAIAGMVLKPWTERTKSATALQNEIQKQAAEGVAGQQIVAFQPPPLPGSQGLPVQFVIKTTDPFSALNGVAQKVLAGALKTGKFIFLQSDLKIDQPQATVVINRAKAATLGLDMSQVGAAMAQALGGLYVNYFSLDNRSYKVIPQVTQASRLNVSQLLDYPVANINGVPIPLGAIATIRNEVIPESVNHFQQLNAATIQGVAAPGVSTGEAVKVLQQIAAKDLPSGYEVDYGGPMRQFIQQQGGFLATFGFAVIVIFLALAALFNSFRDPLIILVSVPMAIVGALIFIYLGFGLSLNIYTEVGLVTLMGLISKHGILIVEVANEAQLAGMTKREAIEHAVGIRLRPILMTTAAMVLGVLPLIIASGAGAAARFNMGMVIAAGLSIGTLFTLFVLPAVYMVVGQKHRTEDEVSHG